MNDNIECYHPYVKHQMDLYNDNVTLTLRKIKKIKINYFY